MFEGGGHWEKAGCGCDDSRTDRTNSTGIALSHTAIVSYPLHKRAM
ncbi:hypothetical protein BSLA_02r0485 [Burkholderia stabilis]|nr:hypothetical protein BSLA_02r0485 [Burkholderia stabilis]